MSNLRNNKNAFHNKKFGRPSQLKNIRTQISQNPQDLVSNKFVNSDIYQTKKIAKQISNYGQLSSNENKKRRCRTEAKQQYLNSIKPSNIQKSLVRSLFSKQIDQDNLQQVSRSLPKQNSSRLKVFNEQKSIRVTKQSDTSDLNAIIDSLDQHNQKRHLNYLRSPNSSKMSNYYLESCDRNRKKIQEVKNSINKTVLLTKIEKYQQSIKNTYDILQDLREFSVRPQKYKNFTEINQSVVICLYNIATNLKHLQKKQQSLDVYKKAYQYALKNLSSNHHLTLLLKRVSSIERQQSRQALQQFVRKQTSRHIGFSQSKQFAGKRNSLTLQAYHIRNQSKLLPISQKNKNKEAYQKILQRSGIRQVSSSRKSEVQKLIRVYRYGLNERQRQKPLQVFNVADIKMKPIRKNHRLDTEQVEKFKEKQKKFEQIYQNGVHYKIKKNKMSDKIQKQQKPRQIIRFQQVNKINIEEVNKQQAQNAKHNLISNQIDIKIQSQVFSRQKLKSFQQSNLKQQSSWCQIF